MYHARLLATFDSMTNAHGPNEFFDLDGDNSVILSLLILFFFYHYHHYY